MDLVVTSQEIEVAVHDLGGEGPNLLLAHATGLHGRCWEPVARRLPARRCLALDFRGHGMSSAPEDHDFDWEGFAEDVLAVVEELELGRCAVAGHSKGGAALLLAEQSRPGTFEAVWCYEPVVFPGARSPASKNPLAEGARRRKERFASLEDAFDNFRNKPPFDVLPDESLWAYVRGGFAIQPDGSVRLRCQPEHEARVYEMGTQHRAYDLLSEVRCPVTVVRGRLEPGPAMVADEIAQRLPLGRLEVHEDLGHFGPLEDPDRIARSIDASLRTEATGDRGTHDD